MANDGHFHLSMYISKQNFSYWVQENLHLLYQSPPHSEKIKVCLEWIHFEFGNHILSKKYWQTINGNMWALYGNNEWFSPNNTKTTTCLFTLSMLPTKSHTADDCFQFPGCVISHNSDEVGFHVCLIYHHVTTFMTIMKAQSVEMQAHSVVKLKQLMTSTIQQILLEILRKTIDSLKRHSDTCLLNSGIHITDLFM